MKVAEGNLNISAIIECPYCKDVLDLFDKSEFTDDGYIYSKLLGNDEWGTDNFDEEIECSECGKAFKVGKICW